jgi:hypothetical protein
VSRQGAPRRLRMRRQTPIRSSAAEIRYWRTVALRKGVRNTSRIWWEQSPRISIRRSFANLSPRIRIHIGSPSQGGDPVGWSGPAPIFRTPRALARLAHG